MTGFPVCIGFLAMRLRYRDEQVQVSDFEALRNAVPVRRVGQSLMADEDAQPVWPAISTSLLE